MKEKRYNQKRACALAWLDLRVYRRGSKLPADTELRDRLKELSTERRRFGYRRLHILLNGKGWHVNWKKLCRLNREEGSTFRKRGGRKRALAPEHRWQSHRGQANGGRWISYLTACRMTVGSACQT